MRTRIKHRHSSCGTVREILYIAHTLERFHALLAKPNILTGEPFDSPKMCLFKSVPAHKFTIIPFDFLAVTALLDAFFAYSHSLSVLLFCMLKCFYMSSMLLFSTAMPLKLAVAAQNVARADFVHQIVPRIFIFNISVG